MKKYENEIDYKGFNIVKWNDNGKKIFAIGTKEFPNIVFAKEYVNNITMKEQAYKDEFGVWRWKSNNRVPFTDMLKCWNIPDEEIALCIIARDKDDNAFLADYREAMKNHKPSEEEMFEMRAAYGKGVTVVNVVTGQKYRT